MSTTHEVNPFGELLSVLNDEELIRFRIRLRNANKTLTADILSDELEERALAVSPWQMCCRHPHGRLRQIGDLV